MALSRVSRRERFEFGGDAVDVRGREVRTELDDEKVGTVDDVLVDDSGSARYLDVDLGFLKKHVLVPVGHAVTDRDTDVVRVRGMNRDDFRDIPETMDDVDRGYEARLAGAYDARIAERVDQMEELEVADHDPNPKGWAVVAADGERIGRVDHLIGDAKAMKVRYLSVDLSGGSDRKVLIPTEYVALDTDGRSVRLNSMESSRVRSLPEYGGQLDRAYAERLNTELATTREGATWYEHPRYSTTGLYGTGAAWF